MIMATSRPAVLFDIDGTLVDSNYLHVHAWQRAFTEVGLPVEAWRIHRSIGMDGSTLVDELSAHADEDVQKRLKDLHTRYYEATAALLTPLPGARRCYSVSPTPTSRWYWPPRHRRTNSPCCARRLTATTSSRRSPPREDVEEAKPRPDIVEVALDKAGVVATEAVFVGDTVWDVEAAKRAGVACIGVLSGGVSRGELENAGAAAVFENTEDLLVHFADSPIVTLR